MIPPSDHPREKTRLNVLRTTDLFRTDEEDDYERFVLIAATIAQTPIALFSLVDERIQWFKARLGTDIKEGPRNSSFCGHAIVQEGRTMVVEDALFDMRFCDNPMVLGDPGIRFYAGVPLRLSRDQLPIGTLCVIDRQPRTLSEEALQALVALGEVLERHITLRSEVHRLGRLQ